MLAVLWTLTWHFGIGGGAIIAALSFAWFSPIFKMQALIVAGALAVGLACYSTGVVNENAYWSAKWASAEAAAVKRANDARQRSTRAVARGLRDPLDTDNHK